MLPGGGELSVLRPRDSEALLDEHAFETDEFLPYWAELWPSGVALAREIAPRSLRGAGGRAGAGHRLGDAGARPAARERRAQRRRPRARAGRLAQPGGAARARAV